MSKTPVLKQYSVEQCKKSCNDRHRQQIASNISDPDPANAYLIHQAYAQHNQCVKNCTTNNIRPYGRN